MARNPMGFFSMIDLRSSSQNFMNFFGSFVTEAL